MLILRHICDIMYLNKLYANADNVDYYEGE